MAFRQQRDDALDGGYRIVVWDDALGHASIWEYDAGDALRRRGVITHYAPTRPDGVEREAVWHGPDGAETDRRPLDADDTGSGPDA